MKILFKCCSLVAHLNVPVDEHVAFSVVSYIASINFKFFTSTCVNRKLITRKIHPEVLSRWCKRNDIEMVVRKEIHYDMTVDLPAPRLQVGKHVRSWLIESFIEHFFILNSWHQW